MSDPDDDSQAAPKPGRTGSSTNVGGSTGVPSSRTAYVPDSRRPPNFDEVFLDEDEVEPDEEDTRSVSAFDALGLGASPFQLDDETQVIRADEIDSGPSSARLSAPPGAAINVRAAVSAPPMSVRSVRPPAAAPPPFASNTEEEEEEEEEELSADDWDAAEGSLPEAALQSDVSPEFEPDDESAPDAAEHLEEAELESETELDQLVPSRTSARALRGSIPPWERKPVSETSESHRGVFPTARPGSAPPPPPGLIARTYPSPASYRPPAIPKLAGVDVHQAPKTLVSGPPPSPQLPEPMPIPAPYEIEPQRSPKRGGLLAVLLIAIVGLVGGGFWMLERTEPGSLIVTVSGPGNQPLARVQLFLDGVLVCQTSPCEVRQLALGTHLVRASAEGYPATADHAVLVTAGKQAAHNIVLERTGSETRLSIVTQPPGFKITIDGKDYGTSPVELSEVTEGEHTIEISRDGYETLRERVTVAASEHHSLGPFRPRLVTGKLEVRAGASASDADVRLNGKRVELPLDVALEAGTEHVLRATKNGFQPFERSITFSENEPTLIVELELEPGGSSGVEASRPETDGAEAKPTPKGGAKGMNGTLSFNSIPASSVVLDGRPLGETPRVGVSVSPGRHNVVFVHPERGRKSVQVDVEAGQSRAVSVRF